MGTPPPEGTPAYDVPEGDRLLAVVPHGPGDDAILQARDGKALRLALDGIRPVKTASAGGVAGMRLERGDAVVGATRAVDDDVLLVLHRRGAGKAVPVHEYPAKGRGTGGVVSAATGHPEAHARRPGAHRAGRAARGVGAGGDLGWRPAPHAGRPARALDARHGVASGGPDRRWPRGGGSRPGTMTAMPSRPCVCDLHLSACDASCNRRMLEKTFYMACLDLGSAPAWWSAPGRWDSRRSRACSPPARRSRSSRPRPCPRSRSSPARAPSPGTAGSTRPPTSRAASSWWPPPATRPSTCASSRTRSAGRCSSTSSTCRRCATSSCRPSCAPARSPSPSPRRAPARRWPSG